MRKNKNSKNKLSYNDKKLKLCSRLDQNQLLKDFGLKSFTLTQDQVADFQKTYGKNVLKPAKIKWFIELVKALLSPFNIILLIICAYNFYSYFADKEASLFNLSGAIIIIAMVLLSSLITYFQTMKANFITKKLTNIVSNKATAIRNSESIMKVTRQNMISLVKEARDIDVKELVPGDLIYMSSGDMVPADVRILVSSDLFINQSALTGESIPTEKHAETSKTNLLELENICLMGTSVVSGSAICIVVNTGLSTYFSSISESLKLQRPLNSFEKGVKKVTLLLILFMIVMVPIVFAIYGGLHTNAWLTAFSFAISIAVGLTPEMLPMVITSNLARGAYKMSKSKVLVKNLSSIQNLGAIDVLCTDKTGTLTNDKIELVQYGTLDNKKEDFLMQLFYLNSYYQTGMKNPLDSAIVNYVQQNNLNMNINQFPRLDEIPFDFNRRRLTIVVQDGEEKILICKGAAEEISKNCVKINYKGKIIDLDDKYREQIERKIKKLNSLGYRVLVLAYKKIKTDRTRFSVKDEQDLIFYGYVCFMDIPKPSAHKMIKILKKHGVSMKILTGDNEYVTRSICARVNLNITGIIFGDELDSLADYELKKAVEKANVFVKLNPLQKARIIKLLKANDHVVGFMGDGINDAPVLRQSDVAISVDNATDIAKEASDIILLEKSLSVLEKGIVQGRTIFGNILKYIKITIASNFGNVLSVMIASFWLPFQPMLPVQILFQNLLYDISQFAIAFDRVDQEFLNVPQRWNTREFLPFAFVNGTISSVFDVITFAVLGYAFGYVSLHNNGSGGNSYALMFQSGWFIEGLITQSLAVQMLRTNKWPFIQSVPPWPVNVMTGFVIIISFVFTYGIGQFLGMTEPSPLYIPILFAIVIGYCLAVQLSKIIYIKWRKVWL